MFDVSEGDLSEKAEPLVLEEGTHTYYFECKLPPELPSSFEGQYGQIRYLAKAYMDRPSTILSKKSSVVTKKAFTVLSGLDLNFIPEAAVRTPFIDFDACEIHKFDISFLSPTSSVKKYHTQ